MIHKLILFSKRFDQIFIMVIRSESGRLFRDEHNFVLAKRNVTIIFVN